MPSNERLKNLAQQAINSLRSIQGQVIFPVSSAMSSSVVSMQQGSSGSPGSNANGASFFDDELKVRALAKEIKRLISEDSRRGLSV